MTAAAAVAAVALRETTEIRDYHAHVYFDASTRAAAETLRDAIAARFHVTLGRVVDHPIGPHSLPMYQIAFAPDQLATLVPWLMLNRGELSIFVHPNTGDEVADHLARPLWLGTPVPLDHDFIDRYVASKRAASTRPG